MRQARETGFRSIRESTTNGYSRFLSESEREALFKTYRLDSIDAAWKSLYAALDLFESALIEVCESLSYGCPNRRKAIEEYIETLRTEQ
ncbi:aminoglycoside 6-adenylyltransferase [Raoultibacter timonensis]|uniref:aminoglycoside 6-adenylyltransferase n=1 Tax=Raoultibacter timonensis TaxID=1907662 RepID=UPI0015E166D2